MILHELTEPWAITPDGFKAVLKHTKDDPRALMARPAEPVETSQNIVVRPDFPDVAIIHVKGPLVRYASWWGGTSYGELRKDLERVLDESAFESVVWVFDSPGGEVNGCAECADAIFAARGKKKMVAYVSGSCASGALWLASAVGDIKCCQTAAVGSIGVITTLYDDTKMLADMGLKEFEIVASQSPKKSQNPADASYRARVQQRIDDICQVFVESVARHRSVTTEYVLKNFGQGDVFVGARAVEAGLADGLSDFESVLAGLSARRTSNPGAIKMDMKMFARLLKIEETASEGDITRRISALTDLERDLVAATESKNVDEAIGKVHAGVEASREVDKLRAEQERVRIASVQGRYRVVLSAALETKRASFGDLVNMLPILLNEKATEKVSAAFAAMKDQTAEAVIAAACSGEVSEKALERVQGWLGKKPSVVPAAPPPEPTPSAQNAAQVANAVAPDIAARVAANPYLGLTAEEVARYGNVGSVAELKKPAQK